MESRLGDMLIELFEESEVVRKQRAAYEDAKRRREEQKIRYNEEVDKTIALENIAQDYDLACKIRTFINALELKMDVNDPKTVEFIDWARKKADWYDPTISREDELFGERNHEESAERKTPKKSFYW